MAAVLKAAMGTARSSKGTRPIPKQLAAYAFKPGHPPLNGGGRPVGSRDAATIYLESLPLKARQWVKSRAPNVLIDARKIALPIESDAPSLPSSDLVIFLERLSPATPSLRAVAVDAEPCPALLAPATLTPSVSTERQIVSP